MDKKLLLAFVCLLALAGTLFIHENHTHLVAYATGEAFRNVYVEQYNGTAWNQVCNATASGGSYRIIDAQAINFTVQVLLDYDYAASASDAISYVNLTIAIMYDTNATAVTGFDSVEIVNATAAIAYDSNNYWLVTKCANWTSSLASAGETYTCTFNYKAYY